MSDFMDFVNGYKTDDEIVTPFNCWPHCASLWARIDGVVYGSENFNPDELYTAWEKDDGMWDGKKCDSSSTDGMALTQEIIIRMCILKARSNSVVNLISQKEK